MSSIVLSCGHEVDDFYHVHNIMNKAVDREGNKAIAYQAVCGPCEDSYRQNGEIFDNYEDAERWLERETW
jgi:hypothetical protein